MKNLFLVINKEKIYAYIVSIMTIVTIFFMSNIINSDLKKTQVTSINSVEKESYNDNRNSSIGEAISTSIPSNSNVLENSLESLTNDIKEKSEIENKKDIENTVESTKKNEESFSDKAQ